MFSKLGIINFKIMYLEALGVVVIQSLEKDLSELGVLWQMGVSDGTAILSC